MVDVQKYVNIKNWLNDYLNTRLSERICVELSPDQKNWLLRIGDGIIQLPITVKYYSPGQFSSCSKFFDEYTTGTNFS